VTVPSGATSGTISVQVGANTVTSSASFTVGSTAPTITSISPTLGTPATYASGSWTPGTTVTITGTNFDTTSNAAGTNPTIYPNNPVLFTPNVHAVVLSASSTQPTVEAPAGATSGPITVSTPGGTAVSASSFYAPPAPPEGMSA